MVRCLKGKVDESGYMIFGAGNEIHIITPHDKNATAFTQSSAPRMMVHQSCLHYTSYQALSKRVGSRSKGTKCQKL
jgi:hypothetical protein